MNFTIKQNNSLFILEETSVKHNEFVKIVEALNKVTGVSLKYIKLIMKYNPEHEKATILKQDFMNILNDNLLKFGEFTFEIGDNGQATLRNIARNKQSDVYNNILRSTSIGLKDFIKKHLKDNVTKNILRHIDSMLEEHLCKELGMCGKYSFSLFAQDILEKTINLNKEKLSIVLFVFVYYFQHLNLKEIMTQDQESSIKYYLQTQCYNFEYKDLNNIMTVIQYLPSDCLNNLEGYQIVELYNILGIFNTEISFNNRTTKWHILKKDYFDWCDGKIAHEETAINDIVFGLQSYFISESIKKWDKLIKLLVAHSIDIMFGNGHDTTLPEDVPTTLKTKTLISDNSVELLDGYNLAADNLSTVIGTKAKNSIL